MPGYREEAGVAPRSRTETYAALRLDVDKWRWAGVPFYVRTGKRLPKRVTEVVLQFQRPPHLPIRAEQVTELQPDGLILPIQPDEGITLLFGAKVPRSPLQGADGDDGVLLRGHLRRGVPGGVRAAAARRADR
jgi:glucose-6-phosphate 1-dehydrogenase